MQIYVASYEKLLIIKKSSAQTSPLKVPLKHPSISDKGRVNSSECQIQFDLTLSDAMEAVLIRAATRSP